MINYYLHYAQCKKFLDVFFSPYWFFERKFSRQIIELIYIKIKERLLLLVFSLLESIDMNLCENMLYNNNEVYSIFHQKKIVSVLVFYTLILFLVIDVCYQTDSKFD